MKIAFWCAGVRSSDGRNYFKLTNCTGKMNVSGLQVIKVELQVATTDIVFVTVQSHAETF